MQAQGPNNNNNNQQETAEIEDDNIDVGASKQSKIMIIVIITVFVSAVIYFMFIAPSGEQVEEVNNDELIIDSGNGETPIREPGIDYNNNDILNLPGNNFDAPDVQTTVPTMPEVPELSEDLKKQIATSIQQPQQEDDKKTYTQEEFDKKLQDAVKEEMEKYVGLIANNQQQNNQQQTTPDSGVGITPPVQPTQNNNNGNEPSVDDLYNFDGTGTNANNLDDMALLEEQQKREAETLANAQKARALQERKAAPIFTMSGGSGPSNSLPQENDAIILSYTNAKLDIQSKAPDIQPTQVTDLTRSILQGKIISAVLETAIDTDLPSSVRAVITRDVYAEEGKNILIPKGSRVIGTYGTANNTPGQTRVTINWNRIIRVDGMSLNIASIGADRLGRAGVPGERDNRYVQQLANSFLSSVLSVGTAIIGEKVSGSTGITNTISSLTGDTTQTSGSASDYAIVDATQQFMQDAQDIVDDIAEQQPVIRIPQGERVMIMVTQDVVLPIFKRGN